MKTLKFHINFPRFPASLLPRFSWSPLLLFSRSPRLLLSLSLFLLLSTGLHAQNEANVWYFNDKCGLNYNSGNPIVLYNGQTQYGPTSSTISDSLGNYLFSSDWGSIYSANGNMQNGYNMPCPGVSGLAIVKWPKGEGLYYLFTAAAPSTSDQGFYYSVIDMNLNNGFGAVTIKNVPIDAGWDVSDRIAIVKKEDSEAVWVIVRKNIQDAFASFLVDENGFHSEPDISDMPDREPDPYWRGVWGFIKISSNKKFLVSSYTSDFEVCGFNSSNGSVEYFYTQPAPSEITNPGLVGIEFSPDSKYLYACFKRNDDTNMIFQYDMKYISDSLDFKNSALLIGKGHASGLQLARDGKIYCSPNLALVDYYHYFICVINKPWERGLGCIYEDDVLTMFPNIIIVQGLPNILVDYLLRFEWTGEQCQGYPIHFKPNFIPTPDSIVWNFDDQLAPGSLTDELSPTYAFQHPGRS